MGHGGFGKSLDDVNSAYSLLKKHVNGRMPGLSLQLNRRFN